MPRVTFVKKARKAVPAAQIEVGDSYYWWQFAFSPKSYSKTRPRRQQLTKSAYLQTLYDIEDAIGDLEAGDTLPDDIADIAGQLRDLASECEGSLENMPEGLRDGVAGQLLQERVDSCNNAADELENIDTDMEEFDPEFDPSLSKEEYVKNHWDSILDAVQQISIE